MIRDLHTGRATRVNPRATGTGGSMHPEGHMDPGKDDCGDDRRNDKNFGIYLVHSQRLPRGF
jgi:hypothetical protein